MAVTVHDKEGDDSAVFVVKKVSESVAMRIYEPILIDSSETDLYIQSVYICDHVL